MTTYWVRDCIYTWMNISFEACLSKLRDTTLCHMTSEKYKIVQRLCWWRFKTCYNVTPLNLRQYIDVSRLLRQTQVLMITVLVGACMVHGCTVHGTVGMKAMHGTRCTIPSQEKAAFAGLKKCEAIKAGHGAVLPCAVTFEPVGNWFHRSDRNIQPLTFFV